MVMWAIMRQRGKKKIKKNNHTVSNLEPNTLTSVFYFLGKG